MAKLGDVIEGWLDDLRKNGSSSDTVSLILASLGFLFSFIALLLMLAK
jgi:tellurite resistance protein TehA-like permease